MEENSADRPAAFVLQQNDPNPFNPATTIGYQLHGRVKVNLSLYNLLGEQVATLVDDVQHAGSYRVAWGTSTATAACCRPARRGKQSGCCC